MSGIGGIGGAGGLQQIMALRQQIIDRSQLLQQVHQPAPAPGQVLRREGERKRKPGRDAAA